MGTHQRFAWAAVGPAGDDGKAPGWAPITARAEPPRHDDDAHSQQEQCIPRVVLTCCCCERGIVYCHPADADVLADKRRQYVCPDCEAAP